MTAQSIGIGHADFWRMTFWELGARLAGHIDANVEDKPDTSIDAMIGHLKSGTF